MMLWQNNIDSDNPVPRSRIVLDLGTGDLIPEIQFRIKFSVLTCISARETMAYALYLRSFFSLSFLIGPCKQGRSDPVSKVRKSLGPPPWQRAPLPRQSVSVYGYRIYTKGRYIVGRIAADAPSTHCGRRTAADARPTCGRRIAADAQFAAPTMN